MSCCQCSSCDVNFILVCGQISHGSVVTLTNIETSQPTNRQKQKRTVIVVFNVPIDTLLFFYRGRFYGGHYPTNISVIALK